MDFGAVFVNVQVIGSAADPFDAVEARHVQGGGVAAYFVLTVRRLRPFARRRLRTSRPFLVLIRTRNPCVRFRWRVFG